jgi:hypothetical protein
MAPVVHGLEAEYSGQIQFYFLDADDPATQSFQEFFDFYYQPEFYLLDSTGAIVKKWVGLVSVEEFRAEFEKVLLP